MLFRLLAVFALPLLLCACVTQTVGDFGRKDESVFANAIFSADAAMFAASARGEPVSSFDMTDEENELRNIAWDLVRPPGSGVWRSDDAFTTSWNWIMPDAWYDYDANDFYLMLRNSGHLSHETYYERLVDQARSDASRLPVFRDAAVRVGKADGARSAAIRAFRADDRMRREAEARIAENIRVVDWVEQSLHKRILAYRATLGRLMIELPSTAAVEAEAAIDALEWEVNGSSGRVKVMKHRFAAKSQKPAFKN